jgi:hypothetical protein
MCIHHATLMLLFQNTTILPTPHSKGDRPRRKFIDQYCSYPTKKLHRSGFTIGITCDWISVVWIRRSLQETTGTYLEIYHDVFLP